MGWTAPLTWVAGQIVTAAQLNTHVRDNLLDLADGSWGRDTALVVKSANESVVASTVMQSDDHLLFSVSANATYLVKLVCIWQANNLNDAKIGWTGPSGYSWNGIKNAPTTGIASGTSAASGDWGALVGATTSTLNVGVTDGSINIGTELTCLYMTGANAGTATFQWAQVVSGSTLTLLAGSWLYAQRVA